jgi:FkbM family methyltransferase
MANRRLEILMAVASLRGTGGSLPDLAWNLFSPTCTVLGGRRVRRVDDAAGGLRAVWIAGVERPIFLPEQFDLHCMHHVLSEETYPRHWHFYATPETPVEKNDVVLDCGAAEGLFTLLSRERGAQVIAFEPHPLYFRALQRTFADDPQVQLIPAALGEAPGEAFLSDGDVAAHVLQDGGVPIAIDTVDAVCDRLRIVPTYLKADIEGFEAKMLAGAEETIASHHPKIAMTTYHDENDARELMATLRRLWPGYRFKTRGISDRHGKPVMLHAW